MPGEVLLQLILSPEAAAAQGAAIRPALCLGLMGSQLFLGLESFPTVIALEEAFGRMLRQAAQRLGNLSHGFGILELPFSLVLFVQARSLVVQEDAQRTAQLPTVKAGDELHKWGV